MAGHPFLWILFLRLWGLDPVPWSTRRLLCPPSPLRLSELDGVRPVRLGDCRPGTPPVPHLAVSDPRQVTLGLRKAAASCPSGRGSGCPIWVTGTQCSGGPAPELCVALGNCPCLLPTHPHRWGPGTCHPEFLDPTTRLCIWVWPPVPQSSQSGCTVHLKARAPGTHRPESLSVRQPVPHSSKCLSDATLTINLTVFCPPFPGPRGCPPPVAEHWGTGSHALFSDCWTPTSSGSQAA